jgi:hypothetical protein
MLDVIVDVSPIDAPTWRDTMGRHHLSRICLLGLLVFVGGCFGGSPSSLNYQGPSDTGMDLGGGPSTADTGPMDVEGPAGDGGLLGSDVRDVGGVSEDPRGLRLQGGLSISEGRTMTHEGGGEGETMRLEGRLESAHSDRICTAETSDGDPLRLRFEPPVLQ